MPRQNRVTPLGELLAVPQRGLVYGNRGCLHDDHGGIRRGYSGRRWIACRLAFRGRRRFPLMVPGRYTELFFLDEATALAAGHRPCAECRRQDYEQLRNIWGRRGWPVHADAIDARLHEERLTPNRKRRLHKAPYAAVPDGAMVLLDDAPWLVHAGVLLAWSPSGYTAARPQPDSGVASVITPPSLLALLCSGWKPAVPWLHPTVGDAA